MRRRHLAGAEGGQAAVELALAMPLVVILLLALVQVVIVGRDQVAVVHAAREGARAAAVAAEPVAAGQRAAREAGGLATRRTDVVVEAGGVVRVTVVHRTATDVPLVGRLVGDVDVRASAVMRREP
jgi:Flp pilus assembly protein TadG